MDGNGSVFRVAYYEAGDRRLARAGATLSRRMENGGGIWRLELPRLGGGRLELEEAGDPNAPPERIAGAIPAFLRGSDPEPVVRLQVARDDGELRAKVLEGLQAGELGTKDGAPEDSVVALRGGKASSRDPIRRLRVVLERQYAQMLRHDPGVRLDLDPEDVHRMRVAVRRARAVLRAARPLLDTEWSEPLRVELKWLGGALGPRRDLDVLIERLRGEIRDFEEPEREAAGQLVELLREERDQAQAAAVEALSSARYYRLLDELESATRGPRVQRSDIPLGRLARREFKRLRKRARRLNWASTDAELHRTRILGKRARYAAELAEPDLGKRAARVEKRAAALQDVLGEHQDAIVAEARLRELLAKTSSSGAAFAAGRLVERERTRRSEARAALPKAWRKLERAWD
ncbi:MAG: CYTH and CHAD domain-containing protein [Gaiellaceae bacterium]